MGKDFVVVDYDGGGKGGAEAGFVLNSKNVSRLYSGGIVIY